MPTQPVRLRRFVVLVGAIILLVVGLASWRLLLGNDLAIRTIEVEGGERIQAATVLDIFPVKVGDNLWQVNVDQARFSLLKATPWLREVQVVKAYPDRLRVILEERRPFVVIELAAHRSVWIDAEGYLLEPARSTEIYQPRLRGLSLAETPQGQKVTDEASLQALRDLFAFDGTFLEQFEDVQFNGSDVALTSRAGFQVFLKNFSVKGDLRLLKRVLDVVEGSDYRYFDLRYNQLIVKPR
ncbi:FtsQ-type POTRA domain-containing protein [Candidatus Acetothermia bacterium]|nr:FtsQ-type POTRA domain-containing protein [Candidatus Acetothermia bacterium]